MKFRKKPVVIDAVQWMGDNVFDIHDFCGGLFTHAGSRLAIQTLEGTMYADIGDWIIKGVKGEFYPCKPDIFEATYEPVEDSQ